MNLTRTLNLLATVFLFTAACSIQSSRPLPPPRYPVTEKGIGPVRIGRTVSSITNRGLRAEFRSNYRPGGWNAWIFYPASGKKIPICAAALEPGKNTGINIPLTRLETTSTEAGTKEGIRPGMLLRSASRWAGKAVLTLYSSIKDSPEYVVFGIRNNSRILFRAVSKSFSEAGKYIQNEGGIILSGKYRKDARIERIIVYSGDFMP